jgi:hypothetical protein
VFTAVADVLEARNEAGLGQGARKIAAALQRAADAKDNPALREQLATLTADAHLVAIANDLDQAMGTICASPSTSTPIPTQGS